jgi:hypothetical protein
MEMNVFECDDYIAIELESDEEGTLEDFENDCGTWK